METTELVHADYRTIGDGPSESCHAASPPHNPGELYDCPACDSTCYCEDSTCLYCQKVDEMETQNNEEQSPSAAYVRLYEVAHEMTEGALARQAVMEAARSYGSIQFRAGWDAAKGKGNKHRKGKKQ